MKMANKTRSAAVATIAVCAMLQGCNPPNYPTGTIEQKYYAPGSWAVTVQIGGACCDSLGNKYDLYYPTSLGAGGFKHPILTWGNGSFGKSANVAYLLKHMVSWGFVVIATEDSMTGPGQTILDAAKFLIKANGDSTSIFFNKLNVSQIGAFGHSQGAGGAVRALMLSGGLIKTVIPFELPAQVWCALPPCLDTHALTTGSVFFIDGSLDIPISPPTQPPGATGLQSIEAFYDAVPAGVPKVKGTLIGPSHNDITGQPDCKTAVQPCINGVYGYLGYPTAWMMYQLQNDNYARGAFVNGTGEMFSQPLNWELVASNIP
jgi:hypothetical protein